MQFQHFNIIIYFLLFYILFYLFLCRKMKQNLKKPVPVKMKTSLQKKLRRLVQNSDCYLRLLTLFEI